MASALTDATNVSRDDLLLFLLSKPCKNALRVVTSTDVTERCVRFKIFNFSFLAA